MLQHNKKHYVTLALSLSLSLFPRYRSSRRRRRRRRLITSATPPVVVFSRQQRRLPVSRRSSARRISGRRKVSPWSPRPVWTEAAEAFRLF